MRTLTDYRYLDHDLIMKGVYDWMFERFPLIGKMPVVEVQGNGIKYTVKTARSNVPWMDVDDTVVESTSTRAQRSAALSQIIGDADTNKFAIATNGTQNPRLLEIKDKTDDLLWQWKEAFIYGQTTTESTTKQPKGLLKLIAEFESEATTDLDAPNNGQVIAGHATSAALTLDMLDELIHAVRDGCNALLMSPRMQRKVNSLARASGSPLRQSNDNFGQFISEYNGIPIYVLDNINDNFPDSSSSILTIATYNKATTRASTLDNSVIFGLHLGDNGTSIIQAGAMTHEDIGTVQNKDAIRDRFKWYCGNACYSKYSAAVLINVLDTALS